jgi:hypothetical protein
MEDEPQKSVVELAEFTEADAIKFARATTPNVSLSKMYDNLYVSYRTFLQHIGSGCKGGSLTEIATYTLGTWTYLYEKQSAAQNAESSEQPILTLDDVLLEYLPLTHPHQSLLLGYTIALLNDYPQFIRPFLPSLILLTNAYSRRATLELLHILFRIGGPGWEDFLLCMALSRTIGYEDEYLKWLSEHMKPQFIEGGVVGHLLRLGKYYPSLSATVARAIQLSVPHTCKSVTPDFELVLTDLIQLICVHSLESQSSKHLRHLASVLPPKSTPLPSLALLIHLTLLSLIPNHSTSALHTLHTRQLNFTPLRQTLPPSTLKDLLAALLLHPTLRHLCISIAHDWKDHIDYDEETDDHMESTAEFLDRVEREYLTATEGVRWRFEDVLAEWIGEWPDGREMWSSKVPKRKSVVIEDDDDDDDEEEEEGEWGGSIVKRDVVRSGLILETPLSKDEGKSEKNSVVQRLFKLAGLGSTTKAGRDRVVCGVEDFSPVVERLGREKRVDRRQCAPRAAKMEAVKRNSTTLLDLFGEEDELESYDDILPTKHESKRKKRRYAQGDSESEANIYEEPNAEDIVNPVWDAEDEPRSSDIDELSISYDRPKAFHKPPRSSSRHSLASITNKMLIRESSPIIVEDESDDELAI